MASSKIKGITIEIDGNTTKLQDSLKDVNKTIYNANSELKELKNALKLDPKNTELLAQKQEVLRKNIQASTEKLNQLKEAQRQMGAYNNLTEEQKEKYRALSVEIAKSENAIKSMNNELKQTNKLDFTKVKDGLKKVGEVASEVLKKVVQVTSAISAALAGMVVAGVKSYAELEQNLGGVETLFGDSAKKVIANATEAYKTAGVSANAYMQGVTSFAASLLQSLGGDTDKAADVADMAFRDMSDNANKFGTDMSSIQNAYQGFAKQNYTMLDNLKLGYGGTKTEMERLLKDAQKLTGVKYNISNLSDVYSAIHVIQEELGVTGTTAKEASETISGSISSTKAAFDNFLNGSGSPDALVESINNVIKNVLVAVEKLAPSILNGIVQLITDIVPTIAAQLFNLIPTLLASITDMIRQLLKKVSENKEDIKNTVTSLINTFVNFLVENLPMILELGIQVVIALAQGIAESLPTLIPAITDCILTMVDTLLDNIDQIIDAAIELMIALTEGLINALPILIERAPEIIVKLVAAIIRNAPKLVEAAFQIIVSLKDGIIANLPKIWDEVKKIPGRIGELIKEGVNTIKNVGKDIMQGLWDGITEKWDKLKGGIKNIGSGIVNGFKSFFGIHSPSRLMRDQIGDNIGLGLAEGIEETLPQVEAAMRDLNSGIQASVNPTINPTANSNPLILNIENFNNTRETDIQELAEELEFYRRNSSLAKGGA